MRRLALTAPALMLAACGGATHTAVSTVAITQTGTAQPTVTQTVGSAPPPATAPKTVINAHGTYSPVIDNDGSYLVYADILPGKYRNAGGTTCYWARLRSPDPGDIIDTKKTGDPQEIGIQLSDVAFVTQNCGTWQMFSPVP